jgi:hypothetical protein
MIGKAATFSTSRRIHRSERLPGADKAAERVKMRHVPRRDFSGERPIVRICQPGRDRGWCGAHEPRQVEHRLGRS